MTIELLAYLTTGNSMFWIFTTVAACAVATWRLGWFPAVAIGVVSFGTLFVSLFWVYGYTDIVYCGSERMYPDEERMCVPGFRTYADILASHHEYGQSAIGWAVGAFAVALAALGAVRVLLRRSRRRAW